MIDKLKMVSASTIQEIQNLDVKAESIDLDYKEIFKISTTKDKIEFVKDLVAFANSKGGYLIYGVTNSFEWIGLDDRSDINCDEAIIGNIIDEYVDGTIDFISNIVELKGDSFFVIYVYPSQDILPFKKDGQYNKVGWGKNNKQKNFNVFTKGDIYCRRNSRSIKADNLFFRKKRSGFSIIENVTIQSKLYTEFIGRKDHLLELDSKLKNENNRIIQIDGIGGIGKTSFVHYFCIQLIEGNYLTGDYEFIIWTSSKRNRYTPKGIKLINEYISNYSDLIGDIYKFIEGNQLESEEDNELEIEDVVKKFLIENKVLLIVDNLETLNDTDLIIFLENFPNSSKAILTTRETLGDFYMARINLEGFKYELEFPDFLNSQYKWFSGKNENFTDIYGDHISDLYKYTKGMPLAGQLITHQLSLGTPISTVLNNLKNGKAYEDILTFCFKGSIDKLSNKEQALLYIFSLSEKDDLLTKDDLLYISGFSDDDIGLDAIPKLTKISLCFSSLTDSGEIGYSVPHLVKIYTKQNIKLNNEQDIIAKYDLFIQERKNFNSDSLGNIQLLTRSKARSHKERVLADKAMHGLSIANYDYDAGIKLIQDLIQENNKFAFLYLILGKIELNGFSDDSYEKAKKSFLISVDLDEDFVEAWIEIGYLELKSRTGKKKNSKEILDSSLKAFKKAEALDGGNQRIHLGIAQVLAAKAKKINANHKKMERLAKGREANDHFERAYYDGNLSSTEKHSNAITCCGHAYNLRTVTHDYDGALRVCEKGLEYEPYNKILLGLRDELAYSINPDAFMDVKLNSMKDKLTEKGWIKK